MKAIHIRNLEKYNPGYTDRSLIWCKIYFTMLNSNYEFELVDDVDKWRLIALIMLEIQMKKPIPYDEKWLQRKITTHKRPISLTIKMLHNFLELVTLADENPCPRVDKNRVDKNRYSSFSFSKIWDKYPQRTGRKSAERHFKATVKTEQDFKNIQIALKNYLESKKVAQGFIQNGSTWFNNWQDWVTFTDPICTKCKGKGKYVSGTGYEIKCDCNEK